MTSGDSYVALWMYLIPLNCILSNGQDGKFYVYWSQFKKWKNQLKMDCKLNYKAWNYKTQRNLGLGKYFYMGCKKHVLWKIKVMDFTS